MDYYILEGKTPVKVDFNRWERWLETGKRRIRETSLGGITVKTSFIPLDKDENEPAFRFYSCIIYSATNHHGEKYLTWDEAIAGHETLVEKVRSQFVPREHDTWFDVIPESRQDTPVDASDSE